ARGRDGRTMMCSTAAVQVNVGLGTPEQVGPRWRLAHDMGPTLAAAFANSPRLGGRYTGWKSTRLATWFAIDPGRTAPPRLNGGDPPGEYASYALDAGVMLIRNGTGYVPMVTGWSLASWLRDCHGLGWPT